MLHLINKSTFEIEQLASHLMEGDAVLLIEEAVSLLVLRPQSIENIMRVAKVYVLDNDIKARALRVDEAQGVECVSYDGFVRLVEQHNPVRSWFK